MKAGITFFLSGAYGWYVNFVALDWVPQIFAGWFAEILIFVAIGAGLWSATAVGHVIERKIREIVSQWWNELPTLTRERKQDKAVKWLLAPVMVWMAPILLALFGMISAHY